MARAEGLVILMTPQYNPGSLLGGSADQLPAPGYVS
jgi:hypothetical protein